MSEVEKIMSLSGDCESALHESFRYGEDVWPLLDEARAKLRAAAEDLVAERDRLSTELDLVSWSFGETPPDVIAKVLDVKANERREREADRKRFPDPAFNEWLDEEISDFGHTVWDATENIADAWAGWQNREYYGKAQAHPQERECECCSGTGAINERLGGEWNANPAAKCPECDGAGVWEGKAQVQQESYLEGVNIDRLIEALTEAGCASGGHEETAARLADYVNRLTLSVVSNGKKIRAQVQQEPPIAPPGYMEAMVEFVRNAPRLPDQDISNDPPAMLDQAQVQHEPLDRSDAVNLARNIRCDRVTPGGVRILCDAIIAMEAELSRLYAAPVTQVQQEQCYVHRLMQKINGEFIPASEFFTGDPPSDWVALVNTYPGEWGIQRRVTGQQIAEGLSKALTEAKAQVQQEPQEALFLLHTGKFYDGEQDEWEIEADSYNTVSAFCRAHPEQTIGLYAAPVGMDKLREAAQAAFSAWNEGKVDLLDANMEALIEALETTA